MCLDLTSLVCLHLRLIALVVSIIKHGLVSFIGCGKFLTELVSNIASAPSLSLLFPQNSHCVYVRHVHPNLCVSRGPFCFMAFFISVLQFEYFLLIDVSSSSLISSLLSDLLLFQILVSGLMISIRFYWSIPVLS